MVPTQNRALVILEQRERQAPLSETVPLTIQSQLAILNPTERHSATHANPQRPISRTDERRHRPHGETSLAQGAPRIESNSVESNEASISGQPEIPVGVLRDAADPARRQAFVLVPRCHRVVAQRSVNRTCSTGGGQTGKKDDHENRRKAAER